MIWLTTLFTLFCLSVCLFVCFKINVDSWLVKLPCASFSAFMSVCAFALAITVNWPRNWSHKGRGTDSRRLRAHIRRKDTSRTLEEDWLFPSYTNALPTIDMTEMFSTLFGQNETQGPPGSSSLGFGPGKPPPPLPQNQVPMAGQMPPQLGDEGPALRKPGAMNEPFYLLRELPGTFWIHFGNSLWFPLIIAILPLRRC